jgi:predicted phosphoadenosine phosphosulfate sulfurtransferase
VWKAIADNGWDYNKAYDSMTRFGIGSRAQRIAPPTMTAAGIPLLGMAIKAWPAWFDKLERRCPGMRTVAQFGRRAVYPTRKLGETWQECYWRENVEEAPDWIAERCKRAVELVLKNHRAHSTQPYPEATNCPRCGTLGNWMRMAKDLYMGDPFALKVGRLGALEPEFFREGAGVWGGTPSF